MLKIICCHGEEVLLTEIDLDARIASGEQLEGKGESQDILGFLWGLVNATRGSWHRY